MTAYRMWTHRLMPDGVVDEFDTGTADVPGNLEEQDVIVLARPGLTSAEVADRLEALIRWVERDPNLRLVPGPPEGDAA